MKKILSIIVGLILMLTLASCQNGKKFAENDFKASMEALQKGDFSKLNSDKESVEALQVFSGAYKKLTYKINKVTEESKDKVLVNVTMKYPDLSEAGKIFQNKLLKESIDEKLNDKNLKYLEETFDMVYVKQNGKWELEGNNLQFIKVVSFNYKM